MKDWFQFAILNGVKITSIIFDWDGTLAMTLPIWLSAYRHYLRSLGHDFSDQLIVQDFFTEHEKGKLKHPAMDFDRMFAAVRDYMANHLASVQIYSQARVTLEKLSASGITLILVSASPRQLLDEGLRVTGLAPFFAATISGDDVTHRKPHPEAFQLVLAQQKLDPATTMIVGDSPADILAARAAGLTSCLFVPTENNLFYDFEKVKLHRPDYCAESLDRFADLVLSRHNNQSPAIISSACAA